MPHLARVIHSSGNKNVSHAPSIFPHFFKNKENKYNIGYCDFVQFGAAMSVRFKLVSREAADDDLEMDQISRIV
jgi:hypothetical protein